MHGTTLTSASLLLIVTLVSASADAQPTPPTLPEFANNPLLNTLSGIASIAVGVFGWLLWHKAQRSPAPEAPANPTGPALTMHFDGPMHKFMEDWEEIAKAQVRSAESLERLVESTADAIRLRAEFAEMLRDTRHQIANIAQGAQRDAKADIETIRKESLLAVNKAHERIRELELELRTATTVLTGVQSQLTGLQNAIMSDPSPRRR